MKSSNQRKLTFTTRQMPRKEILSSNIFLIIEFRISNGYESFSRSRVEDWRADGRVRWHNSIPFSMGLSPAPVIPFPPPATSNPACRFPALGFPADFTPRIMGPIGWERFRVTDERLDSWKTI